jgi:multidrug efflux pump subunit AcrA (membrane-fusion protein)
MQIRKNMVRVILLVLTATTISFAVSSCQWFGSNTADIKDSLEVKSGTLVITVEADGNLSMPIQRKLTFDMPGTIVTLPVAKGDIVKSGQVLATLDDSDIKDAIKQAELNVIQQEQAVKLTEYDLERINQQLEEFAPTTPLLFTYYTDVPLIRDSIIKARVAIESAQTMFDSGQPKEAATELARALKELGTAYQASGVTQFLDLGKRTTVSESITTLRNLTYQKERAQTALERARGAVDSARLSLEQTRKNLSKVSLTAPFGGLITDVPVKLGDRLPAATYTTFTIAQIVDLNRIEMDGLVDEVDIPKVKTGQEATLKADALPNKEFRGYVTYISTTPTIKAGVVSYKVTIDLQDTTGSGLKDGMTATAYINWERRVNIIIVPDTAIRDRYNIPYVEVVQDNGNVVKRPVVLGKTDGRNREINEGLKAGEHILP